MVESSVVFGANARFPVSMESIPVREYSHTMLVSFQECNSHHHEPSLGASSSLIAETKCPHSDSLALTVHPSWSAEAVNWSQPVGITVFTDVFPSGITTVTVELVLLSWLMWSCSPSVLSSSWSWS